MNFQRKLSRNTTEVTGQGNKDRIIGGNSKNTLRLIQFRDWFVHLSVFGAEQLQTTKGTSVRRPANITNNGAIGMAFPIANPSDKRRERSERRERPNCAIDEAV